jgi:hypothetical protein
LELALVETLISVVGGFVSAVIAGIVIKRRLNHYYRPILVIDGNETIIVREIGLDTGIVHGNAVVPFNANRIRVRNTGRSAAKDCKAFVVYTENDIERAAWMIPNINNGNTITSNVGDSEFVDLCAVSDDLNQPRVIPLENGYQGRVDTCTRLRPAAGDIDITVRITSSNAAPMERRARLYTLPDHFPNQPGRIVEFLD